MSLGPTSDIVLSSGLNGWAIFGIIVGGLFLVVILWNAVSYIKAYPTRKASKHREKVCSTSRLYKELQKLNESKRSIKGKTFEYKKDAYVFIRTHKEWLAYSKEDFLAANKDLLEKDLFNLSLFQDDITIYKECVEKLWQKYKDDPESVNNSGLTKEEYSRLEEEVCRGIIIASPKQPRCDYKILVRCGYQGRKRTINVSQEDVESYLHPKPTVVIEKQTDSPAPQIVEPSPVDGDSTNTVGVGAETSSDDAKPSTVDEPSIAGDSPLAPELEKKTEPSVSAEETVLPSEVYIELPNGSKTKPIPSHFDDSFERFFQSIENLERPRVFWATLSKENKALVKFITFVVFTNDKRLMPINSIGVFSFRLRSPGGKNRSLFWFRKDRPNYLKLCYLEDFDGIEAKSIDAYWWEWDKIEKLVLQTLFSFSSWEENTKAAPLPTPAVEVPVDHVAKPVDDTAPAIQEKKADEPKVEAKQDIVEHVPSAHDLVLERFPNLDLDNPDSFYGQMTIYSKDIIDEITLLVSRLNKKIVPQNGKGSFGFGRSDDLENGFGWFGFRKRLGESVMFFYKNDRYSKAEPSTIIANKYQKDLIEETVRRIINIDFAKPVRKVAPVAPKPQETHAEEHIELKDFLGNLGDSERFYYNCSPDEKALIIMAANYSLSLNKEISFGNTKIYFGFKQKWARGDIFHYWYWFRRPDGKGFEFAYRRKQKDEEVLSLPIDPKDKSVGDTIKDIIKRLLLGEEIPETKPAMQPKTNAAITEKSNYIPITADLANGINKAGYFFATLPDEERQFIAGVIRYVKSHWGDISVDNTKNFIGFRKLVNDPSALFWFWFKKPAGYSLQFVYRESPTSLEKRTIILKGLSQNSVIGIIDKILPAKQPTVPTVEFPPQSAEPVNDDISPKPSEHEVDDFWERPFLYATDIMRKCGMKGAVATADITAVCTIHHYSYVGGVAFNNKYRSFSDAIYQSCVVNSDAKIYMYSNPYNCQQYDRAILRLLDELKLFDLGEGRYLTNQALHNDHGVSYAECHQFRDAVKKYLSKHRFFSLDSIRESCAECRFLEFSSSDRIILQFIHSVLGKGIKTLVTDQDSSKAVYSAEFGEKEIKEFFLFIMDGSDSMDIYTIKDRVEDLFGVNYNLDLIGKDSEKAGLYYSDDFEKVYKSKHYFYKEIQE